MLIEWVNYDMFLVWYVIINNNYLKVHNDMEKYFNVSEKANC